MADEVMVLDERISRLETTVAQGFFELAGRADLHDGRIGRLEERMDRLVEQLSLLNRKMDVMSETLEGKIQSVLEHLSASMTEMRRLDIALRREHWADRRIIHAILKDHGIRIRSFEGRRGTAPAGRSRRPRTRRPRP